MRNFAAVVVVILLVAVGVSRAEVIRYTDSQGVLHFVDDISKVPKKYRKQVENAESQGNLSVMDAAPASRTPLVRTALEQQNRSSGSANVEVFLTSWCGYCKKMVQFLNEKGIPYTAYDIEKDAAAARSYDELGGNGVPVVRVGSHIVHGYNPEAVMDYYNGGK